MVNDFEIIRANPPANTAGRKDNFMSNVSIAYVSCALW
jgi:hypothetical protein